MVNEGRVDEEALEADDAEDEIQGSDVTVT